MDNFIKLNFKRKRFYTNHVKIININHIVSIERIEEQYEIRCTDGNSINDFFLEPDEAQKLLAKIGISL